MKRTDLLPDEKPWQIEMMEYLGIVDEGNAVSLVDFEDRAEFDEKLLCHIKEGGHGRGI